MARVTNFLGSLRVINQVPVQPEYHTVYNYKCTTGYHQLYEIQNTNLEIRLSGGGIVTKDLALIMIFTKYGPRDKIERWKTHRLDCQSQLITLEH